MNDCLTLLSSLRRSKLLMQAAQHGLKDYSRDRDLARLIRAAKLPGSRQAMIRLLEEESTLEDARVNGSGRYNVGRHVMVMIALLGEAALVVESRRKNLRIV